MKKIFFLSFLFICMQSITQAQQTATPDSVIRHVVMFGWNEGTDTVAIHKMVDAFRALPSKIAEIKSMEWGTNISPEGLNNGLTHCFILTFYSEADRDTYLVHPAHKAFGNLLNPAPAKITVLDFWAKH